ncbi:hypothetical protein P5V15_000375 [Pogonomyrmex californicus]
MSFEKLFSRRSYYLLVALTSEGQLIFEENRNGSVIGVRLNDRNFLNDARHSIYYNRNNNITTLLIDREPVQLLPIPGISILDGDKTLGATEIQLGGLNTTDPRFIAYKGYTGCLSNVAISINGGANIKPLEEYMSSMKQDNNIVRATIPAGIRNMQCSVLHLEPNFSMGYDKAWVEAPPERTLYKSRYSTTTRPPQEQQGIGMYIFIVLCCIFVAAAIIGYVYKIWRSQKNRQRRRDAASRTVMSIAFDSQRRHPQQYMESSLTTIDVKAIGLKNVMDIDKKSNGIYVPNAKEYKPLSNMETKDLINNKKADEEREKKELLGSTIDLREEAALEEHEREEEDTREPDENKSQKKDTGNNQDESHVIPVRNKMARTSLIDKFYPNETQAFLDKLFRDRFK